MPKMKIFSGSANVPFAKKVAEYVGVPLGKCQLGHFADGEVRIEIQESVRGSDVFIIQSTSPPVNYHYIELFIFLDALKRASSKEITAVLPYYGYARQDRKADARAPISAQVMAEILKLRSDRLVAVDLHAAQIQGFFNGPVDHLFASPSLAADWKKKHGVGDQFVTISPDAGGVQRARAFAKAIECSIGIIDKRREGPNKAQAFHVIGKVKGKTAIIIDDMIDTGGTLIAASQAVLDAGAKEVIAICTHPVFSPPALKRMQESLLKEVWVTDTICLSEEAKKSDKIHVVSIAPLVAEALKRIYSNDSVSALFDS